MDALLPGTHFKIDKQPFLVKEYGRIVAVRANGPDDRIGPDALDMLTRMLTRNAEQTAESRKITWLDNPTIIRQDLEPIHGPPDAPWPVPIYAEYDDDGYGIGDPIDVRYEWRYAWRGRGYEPT